MGNKLKVLILSGVIGCMIPVTPAQAETIFAKCEEYINIRQDPSIESDVVGKIYNENAATLLEEEGEWIKIKSGNAVGYVKSEYFAFGEEAEQIAAEVGYNVATVYPEALTVRTEPSEDSEPFGMVYQNDEIEVVDYTHNEDEWMKVAFDDGTYGYVNAYYVGLNTYYATAETVEEESERLDSEWLSYLNNQAEENQSYLEKIEEEQGHEVYYDEVFQSDTDYQPAEEASEDWVEEDSYEENLDDVEQYESEYFEEDYNDSTYETESSYDETYLGTYTLTGYCGCSSCTGGLGVTSSGTIPVYGRTVACNSLPAGTQISIWGNIYTVEDTGAMGDNVIDIYFDSHEDAINFGQQTADVYLVGYTTVTPDYSDTYEDSSYDSNDDNESDYTSSSSSTGSEIANYACQFVGNPYVWGGTSLTNGADCSGFTQSVFANYGISLPRTAADQAYGGTSIDISNIQPGDLLFYSEGSGISHVALYIGDGQIVHASTSSTGIIISNAYYRTPVCAARYI